MTFEEASQILIELKASSLKTFANKLIVTGIRYSRLRVDWRMCAPADRVELDQERTIAHNAFISSCNVMARNMEKLNEDASWRKRIGNDRKEIGDFACWIHLITGLKAR